SATTTSPSHAVTGASIGGSNNNTNSGCAPNRRSRPTTRTGRHYRRRSSNGLGGGNGGLFRDARCLAVPRANSFGVGHIFGGRLTQPIQVLRRDVRLPLLKRHCDAGFAEGIEDGESQIRARATTFVEVVNKRVEFEVESVCAEIKIDGRRGHRHDI